MPMIWLTSKPATDQLPVEPLPVVTSSFGMEEQVLRHTRVQNLYSVNSWMNIRNELYTHVEASFKNSTNRDLSVFEVIGFEVGQIIEYCTNNGWRTKEGLTSVLGKARLETSRGTITFDESLNKFSGKYSLVKTTCNGDKVGAVRVCDLALSNIDVDVLRGLESDHHGCLNTYLYI